MVSFPSPKVSSFLGFQCALVSASSFQNEENLPHVCLTSNLRDKSCLDVQIHTAEEVCLGVSQISNGLKIGAGIVYLLGAFGTVCEYFCK